MTPCQHIFTLCLVRLPALYGASNGRHHYYGTGKPRDEWTLVGLRARNWMELPLPTLSDLRTTTAQ
jgi:hypothetical protein